MKGVLIYSGGLDSTSALHIFKNKIALAVTFDYGSRHNKQEIKCARFNCEKLGIGHLVLDAKAMFEPLHSALLGDESIPKGHYEDKTMKSTVVPFRNGIMLSVATAIAEDRNFDFVMLGSHKGDNAIYPDCRPEFNAGMRAAMSMGTYNKINLWVPFETMSKRDLAREGIKAGMNPDETYSCYEGEEEQCGTCGTCTERIEALEGLTW